MITYRTIDNARNKVFDLVAAAEGFYSFVYHDNVGGLTLDYDFALLQYAQKECVELAHCRHEKGV